MIKSYICPRCNNTNPLLVLKCKCGLMCFTYDVYYRIIFPKYMADFQIYTTGMSSALTDKTYVSEWLSGKTILVFNNLMWNITEERIEKLLLLK